MAGPSGGTAGSAESHAAKYERAYGWASDGDPFVDDGSYISTCVLDSKRSDDTSI